MLFDFPGFGLGPRIHRHGADSFFLPHLTHAAARKAYLCLRLKHLLSSVLAASEKTRRQLVGRNGAVPRVKDGREVRHSHRRVGHKTQNKNRLSVLMNCH